MPEVTTTESAGAVSVTSKRAVLAKTGSPFRLIGARFQPSASRPASSGNQCASALVPASGCTAMMPYDRRGWTGIVVEKVS